MEVNKEIWGAPSTWRRDENGFSSGSYVPDDLQFKRGEFNDIANYVSQGRLEQGEPIDYSICYAGQAEGMPLSSLKTWNSVYSGGQWSGVEYKHSAETGWFFGHHHDGIDSSTSQLICSNGIFKNDGTGLSDIKDYYWLPDGVAGNYPKQPSQRLIPIVSFPTRGCYFGIRCRIFNPSTNSTQYKYLDELRTGDWSAWKLFRAWGELYTYRQNDADYSGVPTGSTHYCCVATNEIVKFKPTSGSAPDAMPVLQYTFFVRETIPIFGWINNEWSIKRVDGIYHCMQRSFNSTSQSSSVAPIWVDSVPNTTFNQVLNSDWGIGFEGYCDINAENLEAIRKAAAAYGLFFTEKDPSSSAFRTSPNRWTNNDMFCGVLDNKGIGHGEYTRGTGNIDNPVYSMGNSQNSGYKPSGGGDSPIPDANPILPSGLEFTMAGRGTGIWALTPSEIDQVWTDIFGSGVSPKMFGNNPMNAILSLKWTPFEWTPSGTDPYSPIVLGDLAVNELHEYPVINTVSTSEIHGFGSIKFNFDKNFFNARYMQARLFLPFYGYYSLPTAQLLSSTLRVDFYYNVPDDLGVYIICYDDVVYDYVECCCDMEVPLTGSNAAAISASKRSEALSIAAQVGAAAATAIMGASAIKALGSGLSNIAIAGYEGAWGYGGGIKGFIGAAKDNIGILASEGFINPGGMAKGTAALGGLGAVGGGISNTIYKSNVERAALKTNLPYHGSALQTTFLHMSMVPYVQIFRNAIMSDLDKEGSGVDHTLGGTSEAQYKLKVGHACDVWDTIANMPENSLLQATGIADSTVVNMELAEVQELNAILQGGFYK